MFTSFRYHPFAVETFFKSSLVLTYAVAKEELQNLIPPCLTLDTFEDKWAFMAVAMVDTKGLRPKGFPEILGNDFFLMGYRIFVRYTTQEGKKLRGLYILQSSTNKKKMEIFGNIFTKYHYNTTDITLNYGEKSMQVISQQATLDVAVNWQNEDITLPKTSPFKDWKTARRFAGPLPFTFTFLPTTNQVLIIEGVRENWTPKPVEVLHQKVGFVENKNFKEIALANAFVLENIPYYWKKGRIDLWKPETTEKYN